MKEDSLQRGKSWFLPFQNTHAHSFNGTNAPFTPGGWKLVEMELW
jgi:hypothetical protein